MMISRRDFLAGLAATAVLPPLLAARASEPDWVETFYGIDEGQRPVSLPTVFGVDWGVGDHTAAVMITRDADGISTVMPISHEDLHRRVTATEVRESEEMVLDRWRSVFADLEADRDEWLEHWTEIADRIQA